MHVIGTAGHVDHGKSSLIAALTGVHPDRLKEEQERQMTIDLGFGWLKLPSGEEVGIIDVPGHRDFIENMLAGIGGLDAVLLVIAADEGVMPQTREHLAIIDLLQIRHGLIVLNKVDLITDPEWFELVESDIRSLVRGTVLENAPLIRVSAKRGDGLEELLQALNQLLENTPSRPDLGRPRLPIDRVFSLSGFGTIVTGTLQDGALHVGEEVLILPQGLRARIRSLQTHKKSTDVAYPGQRTAANLSGVSVQELKRGDVLTLPGHYQPSLRLDATLRLLPDVQRPLRHSAEVKVFLNTTETLARLRLLGKDELQPGEEGWIQLELRTPIIAVRGDRFILRRPSPPETLGGGLVLDPQPRLRYRRFDPLTLQRLQSLQKGTPQDLFLQASLDLGIASLKEIAYRAALDEKTALQTAHSLLQDGRLLGLGTPAGVLSMEAQVLATSFWEKLTQEARSHVTEYHRLYPLRPGIPRSELMQRLRVTPTSFPYLLKRWLERDIFKLVHDCVALPEHEIRFTPTQQKQVQALLRRFEQSPFSPPTVSECLQSVGEEVFQALLIQGILIAVSSEIVFRQVDFKRMIGHLRQALCQQGPLTVAQVRDLFNSSRKYVLPFLEYLDSQGLTRRQGDFRFWNQPCADDSH